MKKNLKKVVNNIFHYVDGLRVDGAPYDVSGDLSGVWGDLTDVSGDLYDVRGNLTGVWGNLSGVRGNLTGVWGDLDKCEITDEERKEGIDIEDLVA